MYGGPQTISGSIIHILCRYPILVVPIALGLIFGIPNLSQVAEDSLPSSMITFAFDDGYFSTYEKAFPILEKYTFPATVFVISSVIGEPGHMTAEQILELADKGWEIGSHTETHSDLTQLTDEQLKHELVNSKQHLEELGLIVKNFASPYGKYDERVIKMIAKYYDSHRTAWPDGLNDLPLDNLNRYYLKSVSVEARTTIEEVKEWVIKAKNEGKWLILLFHRIDETGDYNWTSRDFEEIVKFVHEEKFKGVSIKEMR
ncbi:MAG: polysaccharide deacetylase family protein [Candidatus Pacebacteria bacterium]|jgi:peptidoglycan/xylan/chitin deacetylase (PgdA/CDA1 family)|nr:polysaccharide deacetylase family protein [Candidatus Paceibacterota bacterium]